jgi:hypothetical protein
MWANPMSFLIQGIKEGAQCSLDKSRAIRGISKYGREGFKILTFKYPPTRG